MSEPVVALVGQQVVGIEVETDSDVTLRLLSGAKARISVWGDCCSYSYFTDPKGQFGELVGSQILEVEDRYGSSNEELEKNPSFNNPNSRYDNDCVSWHFLVFKTSKGHVTVDWRNDSNGYYDGEVVLKMIPMQS